MTDWNARFMALAHHVALWSKDESTKVGAVIVNDKRRIISLGYNGPPRGVSDTHASRETKLHRTLHAEENAILFADRDPEGCTLYVTHHPCAHCAAMIIQAGIGTVFIPPIEAEFLHRWYSGINEAKSMLHAAGVDLYTLWPKENPNENPNV